MSRFLSFNMSTRQCFSCVCSFYDGVSQIREACVRYEKIGMEKDVDSLKSALADGLVNIIQRYAAAHVSRNRAGSGRTFQFFM